MGKGKILLIYGHSYPENSHYGMHLLEEVQGLEGVSVHSLKELYPDGDIDIVKEQKAVESAQLLLFQHPMYWYSIPPILKTWIDEVLVHGWAYGKNEKGDPTYALEGKFWLHMITMGNPQEAFSLQGGGYPLSTILSPLERSALFLKATYYPPLFLNSVYRRSSEELIQYAQKYRNLLESFLQTGKLKETLLLEMHNSLTS